MSDWPYRPFRVSLRIRGGYIAPAFVPLLDGLLWGGFMRAVGRAPERGEIPLAFELGHGVYHGSAMVVPRGLDEIDTTFFRRSIFRDTEVVPADVLQTGGDDVTKFKGRNPRGCFKPTQNEYPVCMPHPDTVTGGVWDVHFYGFGDAERTVWLLRHLPGIGRKAARGYGAIEHVSARPCTENRSLVHHGRPMRPLPVALWRELGGDAHWPRTFQVTAPPYGLSGERIACMAPDGNFIPDDGDSN